MATKKDIISLASKIFGLYLFLQTIGLVQYLLNTLFFGSEYSGDFWDRFVPFLYLIVSIVIYVSVAVLLIERSSTVAAYLVRKEEDTHIQLPVDRVAILQTAFILIGSIAIINILPNLLTNTIAWMKSEIKNEYDYNDFNMTDDDLAFTILKIIIAITIVLNARKLAVWIDKKNASKTNEETADQ
jgi:sterol desaturase/sphingolipid hydroxylase (fatty acid hydroxylase superfamily)